jgi:hypothetical protein
LTPFLSLAPQRRASTVGFAALFVSLVAATRSALPALAVESTQRRTLRHYRLSRFRSSAAISLASRRSPSECSIAARSRRSRLLALASARSAIRHLRELLGAHSLCR